MVRKNREVNNQTDRRGEQGRVRWGEQEGMEERERAEWAQDGAPSVDAWTNTPRGCLGKDDIMVSKSFITSCFKSSISSCTNTSEIGDSKQGGHSSTNV